MDHGRAALDGMLVIALEQAVAAPFCTSRLADAGARVVKIEREAGDFARGYDGVVEGQSAYFTWLNRGKESIVLDIKDPGDVALLERMLARADVFVQNLAPGAAARAGFDSARLRERFPRLVTCDISGYGEAGAYADMKAYDMLVQAESGICSVTGSPDAPGRIGVSACDIGCGMYAAIAIFEALLARERGGAGRAIEVSLFSAMADWMTVPLLHYEHAGNVMRRTGLSHPVIQPYGAFATRGGAPILVAVQNEREFARFCAEVLEQPALAADARFHDNPSRVRNAEALRSIIEAAFTAMERPALLARLRGAGVAYGEVNDVAGLARHPALARITVPTPAGPVEMPAPPARVAGAPQAPRPVPALGEHGAAIRAEFGKETR